MARSCQPGPANDISTSISRSRRSNAYPERVSSQPRRSAPETPDMLLPPESATAFLSAVSYHILIYESQRRDVLRLLAVGDRDRGRVLADDRAEGPLERLDGGHDGARLVPSRRRFREAHGGGGHLALPAVDLVDLGGDRGHHLL